MIMEKEMPGEPWAEKVVIGPATLYRGDSFPILGAIEQCDALVTDPPYGVEFSFIGIELDPHWFKVACDRIEKVVNS
jgi:DNA modification methylase